MTSGSIKVVAKSVKVTSGSVKVIPKSVKMTPWSVKVVPKSVKMTSGSVKVDAESVDVTSKPVKIVAGSVDATSGSVGVVAGSVDVTSGSVELDKKRQRASPEAVLSINKTVKRVKTSFCRSDATAVGCRRRLKSYAEDGFMTRDSDSTSCLRLVNRHWPTT